MTSACVLIHPMDIVEYSGNFVCKNYFIVPTMINDYNENIKIKCLSNIVEKELIRILTNLKSRN